MEAEKGYEPDLSLPNPFDDLPRARSAQPVPYLATQASARSNLYGAAANEAMMTPELAAPSEIVVMGTLPAGETGDPPLTNIPPESNAASVSISVAPAPGVKCPNDQSPCNTKEPLATVVRDVVIEVAVAGVVFVTNASGWADCLTLYQEAAWEMR